jgi:hypothetical protein
MRIHAQRRLPLEQIKIDARRTRIAALEATLGSSRVPSSFSFSFFSSSFSLEFEAIYVTQLGICDSLS